MELFERAKAVRLRSEKGKYLMADEDEESVIQDRDGSSRAARWSVEMLPESGLIRLKSFYGKYLTASHDHEPFGLTLHGGHGHDRRKRKVVQTLPQRLDYSVEWEPIRADEGNQQLVKLRSRQGTFLRANGPWRKSVTHDDVGTGTHHQPKAMLWDVAIVEILVTSSPPAPVKKIDPPPDMVLEFERPPPLKSMVPAGMKLYYRKDPKTCQSSLVVCTISPLNGKIQNLQSLPLIC